MNARRTLTLARRVMRQVLRDHRIVGLLVVVPMLVLTLGAILFRSELAAIPLGIVNEDEGLTTPLTGKLVIGQSIVDELADGEVFDLVVLERGEIDVSRSIDHYIPRLSDSSFAGIPVRHVLDMATGLDCAEEYVDKTACYYRYSMAIGDGFRTADAPDNPVRMAICNMARRLLGLREAPPPTVQEEPTSRRSGLLGRLLRKQPTAKS